MNTKGSDGKSETTSLELITEPTPPLESGEAEKTITLHSPKLSGELDCRGVALLTGYDPPRIYFISDAGAFHIKLTDLQISAIIEDGSAYFRKKIEAGELK